MQYMNHLCHHLPEQHSQNYQYLTYIYQEDFQVLFLALTNQMSFFPMTIGMRYTTPYRQIQF